MTAIPNDATIVRSDHVVANDLSDTEAVMLDIERGTYFGVRDAGRAIWNELEVPTSLDAICARMIERFEVDEETCRRDVGRFLEDLAAQGLIEIRDDSASP